MARILVTGATGMVGRNICENAPMVGCELLAPSRSDLDLLDSRRVERFIKNTKPDFIIHCAGIVGGIQANLKYPLRFFLDNLDIGRNVVLAARESGVNRLLNLGSSCMYPRHGRNPLQETSILSGQLEPSNEGYALAKIAIAKLCAYVNQADVGYQFKTLIPCNLYGRFDNFHPEHSHMVPSVIRKIHEAKMRGDRTVTIWGDGTARREFMYAGDLAACIWRAIDLFETLPSLMNVGLGNDWSVDEYYKAVAQAIGYSGEFNYDLSKPTGMKRKLVDISRQSEWGWSPRFSLDEGLELTYKFFLEEICDD